MGSGAPIVLLHGQPGDRGDWSAVAARLAPDHRVIVPDRSGYGASPGPASGPAGNAESTAELIEALGLGPTTVVGHSYAAAIALRLAQAHPELVAALVLVCPAASPGALGTADRVLAAPVIGEAAAFAGMRASANLAYWLGRLVPAGRQAGIPERMGLPAERIGSFTEAWRRGDVWRAFAVEQRALVAEMPELAAALGRVTAPVTVLAGRRDRVIRPQAVEELVASLPAARLVWSETGGHLLPWREPALVAATVAAALPEAGPTG